MNVQSVPRDTVAATRGLLERMENDGTSFIEAERG